MPRKVVGSLGLTLAVAVLASLVAACGGRAQGERVATPAPTAGPSATPPAASTPTDEPTGTPLPDRLDCEEVRGTDYRSLSEREWFLASCVTPTAPPVVQQAAQLVPPPGPGPAATLPPPVGGAVSAFGDSVMLGAAPQLAAAGVEVTAEVSLQASGGIEIIHQRQPCWRACRAWSSST
jgi:hypothetical protein